MFFLNVQGLFRKVAQLAVLTYELNPNVLCITEHWKNFTELEVNSIPKFKLASYYCRKNKAHDGSAIFVKENITFEDASFITN